MFISFYMATHIVCGAIWLSFSPPTVASRLCSCRLWTDPDPFFPKHNLATVIRTEVLDEHPEIEEFFALLSQPLTGEKMQELNARVDVDGEDYTTVAPDFLKEENLIAD